MEKTLQEQYNLIKEGKGNKAHFLKTALRQFPNMLSPVNTFEDTVSILKNRSIISENLGGLVTSGKKQDWMSIFNENIDKLKEENLGHNEEWSLQPEGRFWIITYRTIDGKKEKVFQSEEEAREWIKNNLENGEYDEMIKRYEEEEDAKHTLPNYRSLKEAKAIEKETTKEVTDAATRGYDYKDEKNYDNVFGQEFLQGYYTELKDPKNADKHVDELRAIVAKNLAKDISHYVKNGQFGTKGVGYTTEAPALGEPKEPKGKYKSSGYGDLKESVLRAQIHQLIKEVLSEMPPLKAGEAGIYEDEPVFIVAVSMHAKTDKDESQPFSYTIKKKDGKIYREVPISAVKKA